LGGDQENQSEGFGTLDSPIGCYHPCLPDNGWTIYDSFVHPFVVLFAIPLSFIEHY
jgi:HAE1 family hydrophobic/amphiphilic exporter-1